MKLLLYICTFYSNSVRMSTVIMLISNISRKQRSRSWMTRYNKRSNDTVFSHERIHVQQHVQDGNCLGEGDVSASTRRRYCSPRSWLFYSTRNATRGGDFPCITPTAQLFRALCLSCERGRIMSAVLFQRLWTPKSSVSPAGTMLLYFVDWTGTKLV